MRSTPSSAITCDTEADCDGGEDEDPGVAVEVVEGDVVIVAIDSIRNRFGNAAVRVGRKLAA